MAFGKRKLTFALAATLTLSACLSLPGAPPTESPASPQILRAEENPHAPQFNDFEKNRAGAQITSATLSMRTELDPPRAQVDLWGSVPSPCSELRLNVLPPDAQYRIRIEAYSLKDPRLRCENFLRQFQTSLLLGVYSPGRYFVWVNDLYIGDFVAD